MKHERTTNTNILYSIIMTIIMLASKIRPSLSFHVLTRYQYLQNFQGGPQRRSFHQISRFRGSFTTAEEPASASSSSSLASSLVTPATVTSEIPSYWTRLNKPKRVLAPMVAQSDLPFRRLCRNHGVDLCFTQMIHAAHFSSKLFQDGHLDVYPSYYCGSGSDNDSDNDSDNSGNCNRIELSPSGQNALEGLDWEDWNTRFPQHESLSELRKEFAKKGEANMATWARYEEGNGNITSIYDENPLIVQIAGHEKNTMSEACRIILQRTNNPNAPEGVYQGPVSGIDINCGCPQGIARKGRYGAFLMEEDVDLVCEIVSTLRNDLPKNVGISCKIRIPQGVGTPAGDKVLKERICKLIDAGVELITVHGRNIKENKTKVRECNFDAIAKAVQIAREHSGDMNFPIISNGGIEFSSDVDRCLELTGASAVMSSEALLENPAIFKDGAKDDLELAPKVLFDRQISLCHEYLDWCTIYPPVPGSLGKVGGSFNCIRAHLFKLLYRYMEENPDIRERLGHDTKVKSIQNTRELLHELEKRYASDKVTDWNTLRSSNAIKSSWYRRHRDAIVGSKMRIRGQKVESELAGLNIEDKKKAMRERLKKMKEQRANKILPAQTTTI